MRGFGGIGACDDDTADTTDGTGNVGSDGTDVMIAITVSRLGFGLIDGGYGRAAVDVADAVCCSARQMIHDA